VRIKILPSALRDLREGSDFYERQNPALGDYFLDSLFSDIDSLMLYAGIHRKCLRLPPGAVKALSLRDLLYHGWSGPRRGLQGS
jgi:plasmid stabilization system protein ParE